MWLFLSDAFLSIVRKDCPRNCLLVRARRQGDIEKVFPRAKVKRTPKADYLFRAVISQDDVISAMENEVRRIAYGNFKESVTDKTLHDAYLRVWFTMDSLQPNRQRNLFRGRS